MNREKMLSNRELLKGKNVIIGVDPSKERMDCQLIDMYGLQIGQPFSFSVSAKGFSVVFHQKLRHQLGRDYVSGEVMIAIESSLSYWKTFAYYCYRQGFLVVLVNPVSTYHSRPLEDADYSKTDPRDAFLVGENALRGRFCLFAMSDDVYARAHRLSIHYFKVTKDLCRYRQRLTSKLNEMFPEMETVLMPASQTGFYLLGRYTYPSDFAAMDRESELVMVRKISKGKIGKDELEALVGCARKSIGVDFPAYKEDDRLILDNLLFMIRTLGAECEKIMDRILKLLSSTPCFRILSSIKGIGEITAALFIAEAGDLRRFKSACELEKFAGLNLKLCDSGQYKGHRRISNHGNKRLRHLIYLICDMLRRYEPSIRQKFLKRRMSGGGNFTKDIIALSSVCLRLIMSLIRRGTLYEVRPEQHVALHAVETTYEEYRRKKAA